MARGAIRRLPIMADVARIAGVSHQTVSRVLNGHPSVRDETRLRVHEAIHALGYRPNGAARALVTRHSCTVGVVGLNTTLYGPASTVYGIEQAARAAGYAVSVVSLRTGDRRGVREAVELLTGHGVDGIVVVAPQRSVAAALVGLPADLPVVAVEGDHAAGVCTVSVDQVTGARLATEHLLSLGHHTVWHVRGPAGWLEAESRIDGWRGVLTAAGRPAPEPLPGDWSPHSGYAAGKALLAAEGVTAVFVANDQMALGVLRAFSEAGVRVPEDISMVGFDDVPESEFFCPPLTTVRQDFDAVGRASIQILLKLMTAPDPACERLVVPPRLILRASTAAT